MFVLCSESYRTRFGRKERRLSVDQNNILYHIQEHSVHEYNSLRAEMVTRIQIMNNQATSATSACIAAWVVSCTIFVASLSSYQMAQNLLTFCVAQSLSALIPSIFLLPTAVKSGENLCQIAALSSYIRVFFDDKLYVDEGYFSWESANNSISTINIQRESSSNYKLFNMEFFSLSLSSLILNVTLSLVTLIRIYYRKQYFGSALGICMLIWTIETILTYFVYKYSSAQDMEQNAKRSIYGFVLYGIENGSIQVHNVTPNDEDKQNIVKEIASQIISKGTENYQILQSIISDVNIF